MTQKSLNDPLTGEEIKTIVLQHIGEALEKNCTLTNDMTYPGFGMKFDVNLTFIRSKVPGTIVWGAETHGDVGSKAEAEKIFGDFVCDAPDKTRVDHDLPVPVDVITPAGHERRRVKIFKKADADAAEK